MALEIRCKRCIEASVDKKPRHLGVVFFRHYFMGASKTTAG